MLDIILNTEPGVQLDVNQLKLNVNEYAAKVTGGEHGDDNYDQIRDELKARTVVELKK